MQNPSRKMEKASSRLSAVIILFAFSGFLIVALKPAETWDWNRIIMAFAIPLLLYFNMFILPKIVSVDRLLMSLVSFLCALGVLILYSTNQERGISQAVYYAIGTVFMMFCLLFTRKMFNWDWLMYLLFPLSIILLVSPLALGREINGAKNWIMLAGISFQPSELVKIFLIMISAYAMSRYKKTQWMAFLAVCVAVLMLQKDLGAVLLYFATAVIMFSASGGSLGLIFSSFIAGTGAAIFAYSRFAHIKKRVSIWLDPWADYENSGYQLVQSLVAIVSGGLFGMGLGLGRPQIIPIYYTDFIFSVICEQFGLIFGILVLAVYAVMVLRGTFIASTAQTRFHSLLALGCTTMICVQTFVIIAGVIKLIPLTGVTMPFVSYGGSSLISSMGIIGVLQGVAGYNEDMLMEDYELTLMYTHSGANNA